MAPADEIELRHARLHDVEPLLVVMRQYYAEDGYPFALTRSRTVVRGMIEDASLGQLWVMTAGESIVGYCAVTFGYSLEYRGRDAFVDELYVLPAWRSRGLGRRALETAEAGCREAGVQALHLEVERDKSRQYDFYRRSGFQDHERYLMTKWLGAEGRTGDG